MHAYATAPATKGQRGGDAKVDGAVGGDACGFALECNGRLTGARGEDGRFLLSGYMHTTCRFLYTHEGGVVDHWVAIEDGDVPIRLEVAWNEERPALEERLEAARSDRQRTMEAETVLEDPTLTAESREMVEQMAAEDAARQQAVVALMEEQIVVPEEAEDLIQRAQEALDRVTTQYGLEPRP